MTSHDITVGGYLAVIAAGVILEVAATRTKAPVPSLGDVLTRIMRTRTGRVGVLVAWAWLGLHFFSQLAPAQFPVAGYRAGSPRP